MAAKRSNRENSDSLLWSPIAGLWCSLTLSREMRGKQKWAINCRKEILQGLPRYIPLHTPDLEQAKIIAKDILDAWWVRQQSPAAAPAVTLAHASCADLIAAYKDISLGCSAKTRDANIWALQRIIKVARKKAPEAVPATDFPEMCIAYTVIRQDEAEPDRPDRGRPNYSDSGRFKVNAGICSYLAQAGSLFIEALHPEYKKRGIILPADIANIRRPKVMKTEIAPLDEAGLLAALPALRLSDPQAWRVVCLAYFAGLRKEEALACRGEWIEEKDGVVVVKMKDRAGFRGKTGAIYTTAVRCPEFAAHLLADPAAPAIGELDPERYMEITAWVRQFTDDQKPVHRLRKAHAQNVMERTKAETTATMAGVQAAANALGHGKNIATTLNHYVNAPLARRG